MSSSSTINYTTLYFGYASNLSSRTLHQRCPESAYAGLARLDDYRWQINDTGYANIVPSPGDVVYGALAFLSDRDEMALDRSEGVPWLYEKHRLTVTRMGKDGQDLLDAHGRMQKVEALAYVDVQRTSDGKINPDYVIWVNRAVMDATPDGLPKEYVQKYIRPFVEEREETQHDRDTFMLRLPYQMATKEGTNWAMFGGGGGRGGSLASLDKRKTVGEDGAAT